LTLTTVLGVLAGAFGVCSGASPLLQAMRTHQRRSSEDVSLSFLGVLLAGGLAWLAYGIALRNAALILANGIAVIGTLTAIGVALRWRPRVPDAP
jgi:uncharacterized protein with PQ loop repeat